MACEHVSFCEVDVQFVRGRCASAPGEPVIIVATGTYAPPHRGHFEMLQTAANALAGQNVAGAIMVPSSTKFSNRKCSHATGGDLRESFPYARRKALVQQMAEELLVPSAGWVHVSDAQEMCQHHYFQVIEGIANGLAAADQGLASRVKFVMVHGGDRHEKDPCPPLFRAQLDLDAFKASRWNYPGPNCDGVVVVPRSTELPEGSYLRKPRSAWPEAIRDSPLRAIASPLKDGLDDFSSTNLRLAALAALPDEEAATAAARQWMTPTSAAAFVQMLVQLTLANMEPAPQPVLRLT